MNTGGFSAAGSAQPVIWADKGKAHLAADQGMEALVRAGRDIYARGPQLVHPCRIPARAANGAAISPPGVLVIAQSWLRRELAKVATWQYHTAKGEVRDCDPPEIVAEQILVMVQDWAFPTLAAVTSAPFLRPDGDLVATEGFDPVSGYMLMDLPAMPLIPTRPTKDSAARALQEIESLLDEFPFVTEVDRSVGLSLVMTPTLRPTFDGWAPLHTLGSPESGTGKSFLLDIASMIATGNWCPVIAATRDPAELDKKLAAVLIAAMPIVSIDNVNRLLSSDLLAQAVERPQLTLRPLGTSQTIIVPNVSTIAVNGNNLRVVDDLVRRTLHAALDADCEAPEQRTFSKDPLAMVRARRGAFIAKILTIARAYIAAGFPEKPAPLPSFQSWGDLIRGALIWLGRADPVVSITRGRAEDPHRQALAAFLESFPTEQVGYTAAELIEAAAAQLGMGRPQWPGLQDALREAATDKRGHLSTERLGYWLRSQKGRVAGRWKLCQRGLTKRREWFREERRPRDRGSDGSDRDDDSVYARVNSEIHIGTNTNHGPDRFIASDDEAPL